MHAAMKLSIQLTFLSAKDVELSDMMTDLLNCNFRYGMVWLETGWGVLNGISAARCWNYMGYTMRASFLMRLTD